MSTLTESKTGFWSPAEWFRRTSFGALSMLIVQFILGIAYSLWGTAPTATKSVGMFSSPLLAIHVILGIVIVITAAALVVRGVRDKAGQVLGPSVVALLAVLAAFGAGAAFVGKGDNGASFGMTLATAIAMACYAANLLILGNRRG